MDIKICRLCLSQDVFLENCFKEETSIGIPHKIFSCTNIQVSKGDGYPSTICLKCMQKIDNFFEFKLECINANDVLKERVLQTQHKTKTKKTNITSNAKLKQGGSVSSEDHHDRVYLGTSQAPEDVPDSASNKKSKTKNHKELLKASKTSHVTKKSTKSNSKTEKITKNKEYFKSNHCEICGKTFKSMGYLVFHMRIHNGNKPYACDVCKKSFTYNSALIVHRRKHSGDKPYICNLCGKGFSQSGNLRVHQRSHTGEQPFQCNICSKVFSQVGNLYIHKRIHSGERRHSCKLCGKSFKFPSHLAEHCNTHSTHKQHRCSVCDKGFHKRSYLSTHMRIHTGERPYSCELCGKSFSNSSNFAAHVRIHTGSKPYVCSVCAKGFAQSTALGRHMKMHEPRKANVKENPIKIKKTLKGETHGQVCLKQQEVIQPKEMLPPSTNQLQDTPNKQKIIIHSNLPSQIQSAKERLVLLNKLKQNKNNIIRGTVDQMPFISATSVTKAMNKSQTISSKIFTPSQDFPVTNASTSGASNVQSGNNHKLSEACSLSYGSEATSQCSATYSPVSGLWSSVHLGHSYVTDTSKVAVGLQVGRSARSCKGTEERKLVYIGEIPIKTYLASLQNFASTSTEGYTRCQKNDVISIPDETSDS